MTWLALFSQTGSEIFNIIDRLNKRPGLIITNNMDDDTWHPGVYNSNVTIMKAKHKDIVEYLMNKEPCFITLHGYLRILPGDVCDRHTVYNGHPGDIIRYPELKGKDPQKKAIELRLPTTGVVLHRAVAEVDAGEIVRRDIFNLYPKITEEQLISELKTIQLDLWCDLLEEQLNG